MEVRNDELQGVHDLYRMHDYHKSIFYESMYNVRVDSYYDWCDYIKNRNDIFYKHKNYLENETDYKRKYFEVCFNIDNPLFNYVLGRHYRENHSYEDYEYEEDNIEVGREKYRYEQLVKENEYWKTKYDNLILQLVYDSCVSPYHLSKVFNLLKT